MRTAITLPTLRFLLVVLLCGLVPAELRASTLDPSHRLWSTAGESGQWTDALRALRQDLAAGIKIGAGSARERAAAVGHRVLVVPVLPAGARAPVSAEDLRSRWSGAEEASVAGFWKAASAGVLSFEVRVLPWLEIPGSLEQDYLNVRNGAPVVNLTAGPRAMARDALVAAVRTVRDLAEYDDDGPDGVPGSGDDDGILDLVVILHPYQPWEVTLAESGAAILSLQSRLRGAGIEGTELRADAFVVSSALAPLGVWAHEFGHLLGLPDLYVIDRNPTSGIATPGGPLGGLGRWSLMASGTWAGGGQLPSGLDAWSRRRLGVDAGPVVRAPGRSSLRAVGPAASESLELMPFGDWRGERFLVEVRRRREGAVLDGALPGSGALVYRVEDTSSAIGEDEAWIELLQADGRDDIGSGVNDGDDGDAFDGMSGRDLLDGATTPSTAGSTPAPERIPPSIRISLPSSDGSQDIDFDLSSGALVRLTRADVRDDLRGDRTHLLPLESTEWRLRLRDAGAVEANSVRVRVRPVAGGRSIEVAPTGWVDCAPSAGEWSPTTPILLEDQGGSPAAAFLAVDVEVDAVEVRTIEIGVPVGDLDGLDGDALAGFVPTVLAAAADTTTFAKLMITELPLPTSAGWGLRANGAPGYTNGAEVALVGGWFALPRDGAISLWSTSDTEEGLPGQVLDGGVLEMFVPDQGWLSLESEDPGLVYIVRSSGAATRDRLGFGGRARDWAPYRFSWPDLDLPVRVRLRFASDESLVGQGWSVAGLQTRSLAAEATIDLNVDRSGRVRATTTMRGDIGGLSSMRFRYRIPGDAAWNVASGIFLPLRGTPTTIALTIPDDVARATVGLFAEVASGDGGSTPPLLLGSAGFVRPVEQSPPRLLGNPARAVVLLEVTPADEDRWIEVFDVRGRNVARFAVVAGTDWVEWRGESSGGATLASGRYFLRWASGPEEAVSLLWLR